MKSDPDQIAEFDKKLAKAIKLVRGTEGECGARIGGRWRPARPTRPTGSRAPVVTHSETVTFSAVELATGELVGDALLWGIDLHNRHAHLGISLRPTFRGKHLGTDIVRVLCHYGFVIRGLHRLQVDTLADNYAMIGAASRVGFVLDGTLRQFAWVNGSFADEVILSLLASEWRPAGPDSGR